MAFLDKLNDFAKNIGDKTGEAIETSKLNSEISSKKKEIAQCMQKIGEFYYEKYRSGEQPFDEILEPFTTIDVHNVAINEALAEIDRIKMENENAKPEGSVSTIQNAKITCANCGAVNDGQKKFCSECGTKIETVMLEKKACTSCGAIIAEELKFCGECGNRVE